MFAGIDRRVKTAFGSASDEQRVKYLDWLRDSMKEHSELQRRATLQVVLLIATFELVIAINPTELTLGPVKITQFSTVLVAAPPLVGYLLVQALSYYRRFLAISHALTATCHHWNNEAAKANLERLLAPPMPIYWSSSATPEDAGLYGKIGSVDFATQVTTSIVTILVIIGFEVHSYIALFSILKPDNPLIWIALVVTAAFIVVSFGYIAAFGQLFRDLPNDGGNDNDSAASVGLSEEP